MIEQTPLAMIVEARIPSGLGGRWYGVYPALVNNIKDDPERLWRVRINLPWAPDTGNGSYEAWARVATLMGGNNRGTWFIPEVNDEVLVAFEGGDPRRPYIIGGLWNGKDKPPKGIVIDGKNNQKVICSRNGVKVTLDDTDGQESLTLETPGGQKVVLKDGPGSIEMSDSNGNSLKMASSGIAMNTTGNVTINAREIQLSTTKVTAQSLMSEFSGVVKSNTHITNTDVSTSYTPGAGNTM